MDQIAFAAAHSSRAPRPAYRPAPMSGASSKRKGIATIWTVVLKLADHVDSDAAGSTDLGHPLAKG